MIIFNWNSEGSNNRIKQACVHRALSLAVIVLTVFVLMEKQLASTVDAEGKKMQQ